MENKHRHQRRRPSNAATIVRLLLATLCPPFLGTVAAFVVYANEIARSGFLSPEGFSIYLSYAYLLATLPSLAYAALMEVWFRTATAIRPRLHTYGTIALSTTLGLGAGFSILLATENQLTMIGGIVGLAMSGILLPFVRQR